MLRFPLSYVFVALVAKRAAKENQGTCPLQLPQKNKARPAPSSTPSDLNLMPSRVRRASIGLSQPMDEIAALAANFAARRASISNIDTAPHMASPAPPEHSPEPMASLLTVPPPPKPSWTMNDDAGEEKHEKPDIAKNLFGSEREGEESTEGFVTMEDSPMKERVEEFGASSDLDVVEDDSKPELSDGPEGLKKEHTSVWISGEGSDPLVFWRSK